MPEAVRRRGYAPNPTPHRRGAHTRALKPIVVVGQSPLDTGHLQTAATLMQGQRGHGAGVRKPEGNPGVGVLVEKLGLGLGKNGGRGQLGQLRQQPVGVLDDADREARILRIRLGISVPLGRPLFGDSKPYSYWMYLLAHLIIRPLL